MSRQTLRLVPCLFFCLSLVFPALAQQYQTPPPALQKLVDTPATPAVSLGPDKSVLLLMEQPGLPAIAELAEPELKLAGLRLNPRNFGPSRTRSYNGLRFVSIKDNAETAVTGVPENARIRNVQWAPDGKHIAFTLDQTNSINLYVANVASGQATQLSDRAVHDVYYGAPFQWMPDSKSLVIRAVPVDYGAAPAAPLAPAGPVIQENLGEKAAARTYQDLLKNAHDEALFAYYLTNQLVHIALNGTSRNLGSPQINTIFSPAPSGTYLLAQHLHKPFSYLVPASRFPQKTEVMDLEGNIVKEVAALPLAENIPTAFGSTRQGPRSINWRADKPATLYWVEAQDDGDALKDAEIRDALFTLEAPFEAAPIQLAAMPLRYAGITWGSDNLAILNESWWLTRQTRMYKINPSSPGESPEVLFDLSTEDRYNNPGRPLTQTTPQGTQVLMMRNHGNTLLMRGTGASPEGNRPFVRSLDLKTKKTETLFRSEAPFYEYPISVLDKQGTQLLTRRESPDTPPNYFVRNLKKDDLAAVTHFPHPYPNLAAVNKQELTYSRADGVQLTSTLYTPPGYDPERDGPLPTLLWAYPREYKSAANAGQKSGSPYRFKSISYWGAIPYVTQGYAVMDQTSMPVIGEGDAEPNDTFVPQLVANAEAAISAGAATGAVDPERVAIGGHSYGAFMTANLLAHSDLFRAGIARSGAYNRTLTPFGFQAEQRTFWEAPEIYFGMSPFMHADKVNEPILLIHGEADNNSGTFPIQSVRYYNALKGHGKVARLVMLPHESHGYRARESLLHMLWETNTWLETHVRPSTPAKSTQIKEPVGR